jgi:hypothetical protein
MLFGQIEELGQEMEESYQQVNLGKAPNSNKFMNRHINNFAIEEEKVEGLNINESFQNN